MQTIIGICGLIGSGKGTVGEILDVSYGFIPESFAKSLKDAVAVIFGWDRALLEGNTKESREFREVKDDFWSKKLGYEVTPRLILQRFGTEAVRQGIGDGVWLNSLEKRLSPYSQYVITDVRFKNEIKLIQDLGGFIVCVERDPKPEWYEDLISVKRKDVKKYMSTYWHDVHQSEWDWIGEKFDYVLDNNSTMPDLHRSVSEMLEYFYVEQAIKNGLVKNL